MDEKKDINKEIQNMELIIAMKLVKDNPSQENRNRMVNEMMKSRFLTPAIIPMSEQERVKEEGKRTQLQVTFKTITTKDGRHFLPAFTDTFQIDTWKEKTNVTEEIKSMVMNFDAYAKYVMQSKGELSGFIINPFGENIVFPTELMKSLMAQKVAMIQRAAKAQGIDLTGKRVIVRSGRPPKAPGASENE